MFGVDFVVHVRIQAAEAIVPGLVGDIGLHGLRFHVLEIDNAGGDGIFVLINHAAVQRF